MARRVVALALGLALRCRAPSAPRAPPPEGPALWLREGLAPDDGPARAPRDARAVGLVLAALPLAELATLAGALERAAARATERANPLFVDLDAAPDAALRARLVALMPALTAADALARAPWRGADGAVEAAVVPACPATTEHTRCLPLDRALPALPSRVWLLAWPVTASITLRCPAARARAVADAIRARAPSTVALTLSADAPDELRTACASRVRRAARALLAQPGVAHAEGADLLVALAGDDPVEAPPWLSRRGLVLVVPRLSAVGDRARFAAEVGAALDAAGLRSAVSWVVQRGV